MMASEASARVALRNLSHGLVYDVDLNLLRGELDERVAESLDTSVGVSLDDDVELLERSERYTVRDVRQREAFLRAESLLALQLQTLVGYLSGLLLRLEHMERVAGGGCSVESEDYSGLCRTCRLYAGVALIEHGLDTSVARSGYDVVADAQRTVAHEHRRHVSTALVER